MNALKKVVAAIVAATSIGAIGVTASAAETVEPLPAKWMAIYASGAPSSVNKTYYVTVEGRTRGYIVECTSFYGGNGSIITVTPSSGSSFKFTMKGSHSAPGSALPVEFGFDATDSSANTQGGGTIVEKI